MNDQSTEAIVYYQITLAVHVDLAGERVDRVVELREEIHQRAGDSPMILTNGGLMECPTDIAVAAIDIAESTPWPGKWEFGY